MGIEPMIGSNGSHLITNDTVNLEYLDWISDDGIPDSWVTLFGRVFDSMLVQRDDLVFDYIEGSDIITQWIEENGFIDRIKHHVHRTVCFDIDTDAFFVEWHLSFPSEQERVAWSLTMDWLPMITYGRFH